MAALVALGPEDGAGDPVEALAGFGQRAGGTVESGVDEADRNRIREERLSRRPAELLREEVERFHRMIAHGDQRRRANDERDAGDVGRVLRFADEEGVQVANAILRIVRFRRLGIVGIGLGRHGRADELLNPLILLHRRFDEIDPDRALRDRLVRPEAPAHNRGNAGAVLSRRRLCDRMDNDQSGALLTGVHVRLSRATVVASIMPRKRGAFHSIVRRQFRERPSAAAGLLPFSDRLEELQPARWRAPSVASQWRRSAPSGRRRSLWPSRAALERAPPQRRDRRWRRRCSPEGSIRLFSKPTRAWPPNSAAAVTHAASRRPKAQTLQNEKRGMSGAMNGRRSSGRAVRVSENRPRTKRTAGVSKGMRPRCLHGREAFGLLGRIEDELRPDAHLLQLAEEEAEVLFVRFIRRKLAQRQRDRFRDSSCKTPTAAAPACSGPSTRW